jgi:hypothetical protein
VPAVWTRLPTCSAIDSARPVSEHLVGFDDVADPWTIGIVLRFGDLVGGRAVRVNADDVACRGAPALDDDVNDENRYLTLDGRAEVGRCPLGVALQALLHPKNGDADLSPARAAATIAGTGFVAFHVFRDCGSLRDHS